MRRTSTHLNQIAILSTGDEITFGDILNTNSKEIASLLFANGFHVGLHCVAPDNKTEIARAIHFLLDTHQALIITGGLGPTSDDLTRFALSDVLNKKLIFDEETWNQICNRFLSIGYKPPFPQGNEQQALFPEGSLVIPNSQGTAAGCFIHANDRYIFMLPGPPPECLPMIESFVMPTLLKSGFHEVVYSNYWYLFGVSEGAIAEELDNVVKDYDCTTGYRLFYPYIEFKIHSNDAKQFQKVIPLIQKIVAPHLFADGKKTASALLKEMLLQSNRTLGIQDEATGGVLQTLILTPETAAYLNFHAAEIKIKGLTEYWKNSKANETSLEISFSEGKKFQKQIPLRGDRVKLYAAELSCYEISKYLKSQSP